MNLTVAILGPTAAGKSAVAMELAKRWGGEIVSVDSMQVYRRMDIGTAKPTHLEQLEVPHHMIDLVDPDVDYSVAEFQREGRRVLEALTSKAAIIAGGSGLHFRALVDPMSFAPTRSELRADLESRELGALVDELEDLDPNVQAVLDVHNKRRVVRALEVALLGGGTPTERYESVEAQRLRRYESVLDFSAFGIDPGDALDDRIRQRLSSMREGGLVDEVKSLRGDMGRNARAAVGYAEILDALEGELSMEQAFADVEANTRKLANRQRTWFQRDPRIRWLPWSRDPQDTANRIEEMLE